MEDPAVTHPRPPSPCARTFYSRTLVKSCKAAKEGSLRKKETWQLIPMLEGTLGGMLPTMILTNSGQAVGSIAGTVRWPNQVGALTK